MKKIVVSFMIAIIVLLGGLNTYADSESANIEVNFTGPTTLKQNDKTLTLTLALGNFTGISDDNVLGYEATLDYKEDIFASVTVKGLNGWNADYKDSTKIIIGDTASAKANTQITEIVFTLKEGVQPTTTEIKLNNILLTNDEHDFKYDKKLTVAIQKNETIIENNTAKKPTENTGKEIKETSKVVTKGNTDTTMTGSKQLPKAGMEITILISIVILMMVAVVSGRSYICYLKDTKKQHKK